MKKGTLVYFTHDFGGSIVAGTLVYDYFDYSEVVGEVLSWLIKVENNKGYRHVVMPQRELSTHSAEFERQEKIAQHRQSIKELEEAIRNA